MEKLNGEFFLKQQHLNSLSEKARDDMRLAEEEQRRLRTASRRHAEDKIKMARLVVTELAMLHPKRTPYLIIYLFVGREISVLQAEITSLKSAYDKAGKEIEDLRLSKERALRRKEELAREHQREVRKLKSDVRAQTEKARDATVGLTSEDCNRDEVGALTYCPLSH